MGRASGAPVQQARSSGSQPRPTGLTTTKSTYVVVYGIEGSLTPYVSVLLARDHGLSPSQIGGVLAVASVASLVAPPVLTILADHRSRASRLLMLALLLTATGLAIFAAARGYWLVLLSYVAFRVVWEPVKPLVDGMFFAARRARPGLASVSFHQVRIWGTVGYMIPGVLLYFVIRRQTSLQILPLIAACLAVLGIVVARRLPASNRSLTDGVPAPHFSIRTTLRAAADLFRRRRTAVFVFAMFLLQASMSAYASFYPLQATETAGLPARWLGPVTNIGVGFELAYMAAFGWFVKVFGWRRLMVLGALTAGARVALLAAVPTLPVVICTQLVHGMVIIVTLVASRAVLDRWVGDRARHTVQGLYSMLVTGGGAITGNAVGGLVAGRTLAPVFWTAAGACLTAAVLLAVSLRSETAVTA